MSHAAEETARKYSDRFRCVQAYERIVVLTEGFSTPFVAKTAISLLHYRSDDIIAVLDSSAVSQTAGELLGAGGNIPVISELDSVDADAIFVGIAAPGGKLPQEWRHIIVAALRAGIDIVSGLHDFLGDDPEFAGLARESGCRITDVRRNNERETAKRVSFRDSCLRIHTVGHDCSVGKMVTALEIQNDLVARGSDARFVATGQTGIMIAGDGVPVDCVVADFVNGAVESLVLRNQQHEILLIEGQGSIGHPSFSAVTAGLLHGCAPDGLIFCYEVGRTMVKGLQEVPLQPNSQLLAAFETLASLRHPCRIIGIAMNSRNVTREEAEAERERVGSETGLPVCDVYRHGPTALTDAVLQLKQEHRV